MTTPEIFLFVSHVSEDRAAAMEIVEELERRGLRCWIAPRDVRPGRPFDDEIAAAIDSSRAMLLIFSERCKRKRIYPSGGDGRGRAHKETPGWHNDHFRTVAAFFEQIHRLQRAFAFGRKRGNSHPCRCDGSWRRRSGGWGNPGCRRVEKPSDNSGKQSQTDQRCGQQRRSRQRPSRARLLTPGPAGLLRLIGIAVGFGLGADALVLGPLRSASPSCLRRSRPAAELATRGGSRS